MVIAALVILYCELVLQYVYLLAENNSILVIHYC